MNSVSNIGRVRLTGIISSLMLLSACATGTVTSVSPENTVEERSTERWEAFFSGDLAGVYEFLSPAYRTSVSSLQYQRSILLKKVVWTSADHLGSVCDETTCIVKSNVGYTAYGSVPGVQSFNGAQMIEESWVLVDGQWYLVPGN
jgi:hypothetical protein